MKNNRSLQLDDDFININELSTDPPPQDSLFWTLWNANLNIANEALNTDFVQGIKNGPLHPTLYGAFNVADAYYCFHGAEDYGVAAGKATNPVLKAFLQKKHDSYQSYNQTFPNTWHLRGEDSVIPTDVVTKYSNLESQVAQQEDPIYTLIVMLPCEYLWAWLGAQLSEYASASNVYAKWITGNNYPQGAYAMGNFLHAYTQKYPINSVIAAGFYREAMNYEYLNFKSAVPPPKKTED